MTSARISDEDIRSVFVVFDTDGTGVIDATELLHALKSLGWQRITEADVSRLMASVGKDTRAGEGLSFTEFADVVRQKQKLADGPEEILAAFRLFDKSGTGRLSAADLKSAGERATGKVVPDRMVAEIMRLADLDRDGHLCFDEFRAAVSKYDASLQANAQASTHFAFGGTMTAEQVAAELGGSGLGDSVRADQTAAAAPAAAATPSTAAANLGSSGAGEASPSAAGTTEVIAGVKVTFVAGKIEKKEVRRALAALGYDDETLPSNVFDDLFADSDADNDKRLTLDEYCTLLVGFGEQVDGY